MTLEQPDYINSCTTLPIPPGPYLFKNKMSVFQINADKEKLQVLCDRYLNNPGNEFEYYPLFSSVFLIFAEMDFTSQTNPIGWFHENEASFWMPTVAFKKGCLFPSHIAYFLPNLFLDDFYAIALGREVYGFRKTLVDFEKLPKHISNPEFIANTVALKKFDPNALAKTEFLMSVERTIFNSEQFSPQWDSQDKAQEEIISLIVKDCTKILNQDSKLLKWFEDEAFDLAKFLKLNQLSWVFLKQFRDIANTNKACYQEVVEAPMIITDFHNAGPLLGKYQLRINKLDSLPLVEEMGLSVTSDDNDIQVIDMKNFFWVHADFKINNQE